MDFMFVFLLLPFLIYWCINEKAGIQLSIVFILTIWIILLFKNLEIKFSNGGEIFWIIIAVMFLIYHFLHKKIIELLSMGGFRVCMLVTAIISFIMILYRPNIEFIYCGGLFLGMGAGYCFNRRYVGFNSANVLDKKGIIKYLFLVIRFILGVGVLVLILYRVEKMMHVIAESQNLILYNFLCCMAVSLWVFILAPWVFIKLRFAGAGKLDMADDKQ